MKAREFDAFGDRMEEFVGAAERTTAAALARAHEARRIKNLPAFDVRCDRCGIMVVKHSPRDGDIFHGLDGRLFKCRECGAVLCSLQVHFTKDPLQSEEIGSHQVYPTREQMKDSKYFTLAIHRETGQTEKSEAHMSVFCGFVDVVEQESGDTGATHTEAENQSGPS